MMTSNTPHNDPTLALDSIRLPTEAAPVLFTDTHPPSGGPLTARRISPLPGAETLSRWDSSQAKLDRHRQTLNLDALGQSFLGRAGISDHMCSNALVRVHNLAYLAERVVPLHMVIHNMSLQQLMEPFLLVDEHQVVISVSTTWLTILLAVDGTGTTSTSIQDESDPYHLPGEMGALLVLPGLLSRLQGCPTETTQRRTWRPIRYRTYSFTLHFTSSASTILSVSKARMSTWQWFLDTPILPGTFPRASDSITSSPWGACITPRSTGAQGYRVHPSPLRPELPVSTATSTEGASHLYDVTLPREWDQLTHDYTPPTHPLSEGLSLSTSVLYMDMTNTTPNLLYDMRTAAIQLAGVTKVVQPAYLTISSTYELEWALLRVSNDGGYVDRLVPTYKILRHMSLTSLLLPYAVRPGGRYRVMIVGVHMIILLNIFLSPAATTATTMTAAREHVLLVDSSRRILDLTVLELPGFLDWLTRGLILTHYDPVEYTPTHGTLIQLSIRPYDLMGLMEIVTWDPYNRRCQHMVDISFPVDEINTLAICDVDIIPPLFS